MASFIGGSRVPQQPRLGARVDEEAAAAPARTYLPAAVWHSFALHRRARLARDICHYHLGKSLTDP